MDMDRYLLTYISVVVVSQHLKFLHFPLRLRGVFVVFMKCLPVLICLFPASSFLFLFLLSRSLGFFPLLSVFLLFVSTDKVCWWHFTLQLPTSTHLSLPSLRVLLISVIRLFLPGTLFSSVFKYRQPFTPFRFIHSLTHYASPTFDP